MISRLYSIRSKIWLCVLTALAGFFISVIFGFYANLIQYESITKMEEVSWPQVTNGNKLLNLLHQQNEKYEDAFMLGEVELAQIALKFQVEFLYTLENQLKLSDNPVQSKELLSLKQDYLRLMEMAARMHPEYAADEISAEEQKNIQQFGAMQQQMHFQIEQLVNDLKRSMFEEIELNKGNALYSLLFLTLLFLISVLAAMLTVNRVAGSLLVTPLSRILSNVERLEAGQELELPGPFSPVDEIRQLSVAFWKTGENLRKTTVSKRYVDNIINNMTGSLVVISPTLVINKVNQQARKLFGYSEAELLGQPIDLLIATGENSIISSARIDDLLDSGGVIKQIEVICMAKKGLKFPTHCSGSVMHDEAGNLLGIVVIFTDITKQKQVQVKLLQMAHHDALTGLANRNLFFDRLEHTLQDAKRHNRTFALLYLDLDKFKQINDSMGHDVGDMALIEVSKRLENTVRADDTVARMGGDEFIIIFNGLKVEDDVHNLANNIIKQISEPYVFGTVEYFLGVSIGISIFPRDGTSVDELIKQSDSAMYLSKNSGGNMITDA